MASEFIIDVKVRPDTATSKIKTVNKELTKTEKTTASLKRQFGTLFAGLGVAVAVSRLRTLSDAFTEIQNQIRVVTDGTEALTNATDALFDIATKTRAPVRELAILYQRASLAAANLGVSQQQVQKFVEATGKAIAIQGGGMGKARGAMIQLSQAIGGAVVRAEEFNSIQEGALPIILTVAKHLKSGAVSFAELRNRVIEGKLSSQEFFEAFLDGADDLDAAFGKTIPTISQAFTVLNTNMIRFIGGSDNMVVASANISKAIIFVGQNLVVMSDIIVAASVVLVSRFIPAMVASTLAANGFSLAIGIHMARQLGIGFAATQLFTGALVALRTVLFSSLGIGVAIASLFLFRDAIFGGKAAVDAKTLSLGKLVDQLDTVAITNLKVAKSDLLLAKSTIASIALEVDKKKLILESARAALQAAIDSKSGSLAAAAGYRTLINAVEAAQLQFDAINKIWVKSWHDVGNLEDAVKAFENALKQTDIDDYQKKLVKLLGVIDPVGEATKKYALSVAVLNKALADGDVDIARKTEFMERLRKSFEEAIDPAGTLVAKLKEQADFLRETEGLDDASISFLRQRKDIIEKLGPEYDKLTEAQKRSLDTSLAVINADEDEVKNKEDVLKSLNNLLVVTGRLSGIKQRFATDTKALNEAEKLDLITNQQKVDIQADLLRGYLGLNDSLASYNEKIMIANDLEAAGVITTKELAMVTDEAALAMARLDVAQATTFGEGFGANIALMAEEGKNAFAELGSVVAGIFGPEGALSTGLNQAITQSLFFGKSFKESLAGIGRTIISAVLGSLIKVGVQEALNFTKNLIFKKAEAATDVAAKTTQTTAALASIAAITTASIAAGVATAAAWTPAAIAVSLATFGGNSAPAIAGMTAAAAAFTSLQTVSAVSSLALADGGLVSGPGTSRSDSIPARLSDGEFVVNAAATRNNLALLEAINGGAATGGGGVSNNRSVNIDGPAFALTVNGRGDEDLDEMESRFRSFVEDEKRSGGLFEELVV